MCLKLLYIFCLKTAMAKHNFPFRIKKVSLFQAEETTPALRRNSEVQFMNELILLNEHPMIPDVLVSS